MRKWIFILLLGSVLLLTLLGCGQLNNSNENTTPDNTTESTTPKTTTPESTTPEETTPEETTPEVTTPEETTLDETTLSKNDQDNPPIVEGELDKNSDLIVELLTFLDEYRKDIMPPTTSLAKQIDAIKSGKQPLHVVFNPDEYYFVCGYNPSGSEKTVFDNCVWIKYDNETEIQEYYNGGKIAVAFQINKALTVMDILFEDSAVPDMEHFQLYDVVFENGVNVAASATFDSAFIYLNDSNKELIYYSVGKYYHKLVAIPCVYLDEQYFISIYLATATKGETINLDEILAQDSFIRKFGEYYDAIVNVMDTEKYRIDSTTGFGIYYYGIIALDDFVNDVLKVATTPALEGELDKNSDLIVTLVNYLKEYWLQIEPLPNSLETQIDKIKNGTKPLHVTFDSSDYYFVCGYYAGSHQYEKIMWCCPKEYTWKKYEKEDEIQEYDNGKACVVVFQMNRASSVTDILEETTTHQMEHFQIYSPTFENGVNTKSSLVFDKTFIYLHNSGKEVAYHSMSQYYNYFNVISCVDLDGQYYISVLLATLKEDAIFDSQEALLKDSIVYDFGEYYDALVGVIDTEKYRVYSLGGYTSYYGVISIEDFVNSVLK